MPGFTAKSGGLVLDAGFLRSLERFREGAGRIRARREFLAGPGSSLLRGAGLADSFWISVFGYERDYARIVADIAEFHGKTPVLVLAAAGKSQDCLASAWRRAGEVFPLLRLPFLAQEIWDEALLSADFNIVRGEETLARAALSGRPFLWQAYVQDGRHHLVKVGALLARMRPFFGRDSFRPLESLFLAFNDRDADSPTVSGGEEFLPVLVEAAKRNTAFQEGFAAFSRALRAQGDLAANLLTFLRELL